MTSPGCCCCLFSRIPFHTRAWHHQAAVVVIIVVCYVGFHFKLWHDITRLLLLLLLLLLCRIPVHTLAWRHQAVVVVVCCVGFQFILWHDVTRLQQSGAAVAVSEYGTTATEQLPATCCCTHVTRCWWPQQVCIHVVSTQTFRLILIPTWVQLTILV